MSASSRFLLLVEESTFIALGVRRFASFIVVRSLGVCLFLVRYENAP